MNSRHSVRERWLFPPPWPISATGPEVDQLHRTSDRLRLGLTTADPRALRQIELAEATASSLIEDIDQPATLTGSWTNDLYLAVTQAWRQRDPARLNDWHATLMRRMADRGVRPGRYRDIGVTVGGWAPPHWSDVQWLMDRMIGWLRQENDPVVRAAWGHRQFETIHPFVDGNGRVGRLLICQAQRLPLPVSIAILARRQEYYEGLQSASWIEWQQWLTQRMTEAAQLAGDHLLTYDPDQQEDDENAAQRLARQAAGPAEDAGT